MIKGNQSMKVSEILDSLNDILGGDIKIKYSKKIITTRTILLHLTHSDQSQLRICKWILILILDKDS